MKTTNKILSIILAILMVISIIPLTSNAVEPTSGICGDNLTWEFDEYTSTLTISGTGDMYYYDVYFNASNDEADDRPWQAYTSKIKNIIINEGVTTISEKAFYNFEYLFFVTIPLSLTRIKDKAFYSWDGLMAINYLGSEEEWKNINIGYDNSDLFNCEKIYFKDDYVPVSGSGTYGDNLTWTYDASTSTLTFFGTGAMEGFAGDGGIFSEPNFFDGIRPWEDYEFEVKHIVISEGITSIGKNAFAMFINLESVEIPCSITQIGSYSFGYCINLTDVYYSGTENDWNNIIKGDIFPGLNLIGNSYNVQLDNATKHYDYHTHDYKASVTEPTCTEQGYTTYTCECGDSYVADYVDALGHIEETVPAVAPTCTETGLTEGAKCSICGETLTEQKELPANGHSPANAVEENYIAPTCAGNGSKDVVVYCSVCDEEISRETETIEATGHADNDGDGYCDADNKLLDPSVECEHACHKDGFTNLIWKIINFFNKLLGLNNTCSCGAAHY